MEQTIDISRRQHLKELHAQHNKNTTEIIKYQTKGLGCFYAEQGLSDTCFFLVEELRKWNKEIMADVQRIEGRPGSKTDTPLVRYP